MFAGLENPVHLLFLLLIVLLVFGPKRLPEMGRSLGHGMRRFRESLAGEDKETPPAADSDAATSALPSDQPAVELGQQTPTRSP
jgi:sec-independent protein translocase protein TatA